MKPRGFLSWLRTQTDLFDALVLDIDGVLTRGRHALPGSGELLSFLEAKRLPFHLLTNDGSSSVDQKSRALKEAGLDVSRDSICSSGHVLMDVVRQDRLQGRTFFAMGRLGEPSYPELAGLKVIRDLDRIGECSGVVIGEGGYRWEPAINAAVNFFIRDPGAPLLVPNPDLYFPLSDGRLRLASGAVVQLIRSVLADYGVDIEPRLLGKPHEPIFRHSHGKMEAETGSSIPPERVLMVGDSLAGDIAGAKAFGYASALVLTGITTAGALRRSSVEPDFLFDHL